MVTANSIIAMADERPKTKKLKKLFTMLSHFALLQIVFNKELANIMFLISDFMNLAGNFVN